MRTVVWSAEAVADLLAVARNDFRHAERINNTVNQYARGDRVDIKKLSGGAEWRIRVGDWRVLLRLDGGTASVRRVLNRRDAYE